jgi:lipopolysaccharide biosynthesis glycosyltransferase
MQTLHVAMALDRNCVLGCAVSMRSLVDNAVGDLDVHFHVACNGIDESTRERLVRSLDGAVHSSRFTFSEFNPDPYARLTRSRLITRTAYAILDIGEQLPADVGRCITLDCDLVFERNAVELWNTDLRGCTVGAVDNGLKAEARLYQARLGLREPRYFNSGVLLVDVDRWRELAVRERAIRAAVRIGPELILHDQDALNMALEGDWMALDWRWNVGVHLPGLEVGTPTVIHYMAAPKPWHVDYDRPFPERFFRYLDRTDFAGWRPANPLGLPRLLVRASRQLPYLPGATRVLRARFMRSDPA